MHIQLKQVELDGITQLNKTTQEILHVNTSHIHYNLKSSIIELILQL